MNDSTSTPEKGIPTNQDGVTIANTVVSVTANRVNNRNGEFSHWKYVASCKDGSEIVLRAKSAHFYNWAHLSQYANTTSAKGIARNFSFGKTKPSGHLKTYEVLPNDPNEWQPEDSEVVRINDNLAIKQAEVAKLDRSEPLAAPVHNPIPAEVESSDPVVKTVEVEIQTFAQQEQPAKAAVNAVFLRQLDKQIDLVREGVTYHLGTYGQAPRCDCLRTGELQIAIENLLGESETFTQQEQPAAQANAELDLYAIELERGIGIKASKSLEDAWRIAEQESEQRNLEIVDVRLADEEDIEWVRSMGGHIPRLPDPADSKGNI